MRKATKDKAKTEPPKRTSRTTKQKETVSVEHMLVLKFLCEEFGFAWVARRTKVSVYSVEQALKEQPVKIEHFRALVAVLGQLHLEDLRRSLAA